MNIFTNKKIVQKVIIAIVIVLSFNFIAPTYSQAGFGGVLMGPIIDFIAGLGDAVMSALQFFMYDGNITLGNTAGSAVNSALTIVNPFDTFLLKRSASDFNDKLKEYDMDVTQEELDANGGNPDIEINADNFDKGLLGWVPGNWLDKDYGVPIIKYTPEKIFSNQVPALDVNFIDPIDWTDIKDENGNQKYPNAELMNKRSITQDLHSTIANWYVALRNLAIVALLSVLLYVGIRMVISSIASDKAKYKQMLMDWVIALCIVFFLHYIMSFILTFTQMITEGIDSGTEIIVQVKDSVSGKGDFPMKTDLTGLCRMQIQYSDLGARMIYLIFYIALVVYTVMFTWTYVKRAITMAFLTLIAPLVAITYPIDKISDGKAQAYGIWLREFIFNALLQPFHLIVYTIFLGAASEIATKNPIYAILFLAFIIPSEKLLRKMFGFEKSSTAGAFAAGFGGAAAFKALSGVVGKGKKTSGGGQGAKDKIRTKNPVKDKNEIGKDYSAFASENNNERDSDENKPRLTGEENQNKLADDENKPRLTGEENQNKLADNENKPRLTDEENQEMAALKEELDNADYNDMYLNPDAYREKQDRLAELEQKQAQAQMQNEQSKDDAEEIEEEKNLGDSGHTNMQKSVIRGFKNVAKAGAKYTGKKLKHRFASREGWKENAKFAGRMAIRGVSAATFGAIGLGMGIAGNDLEDVLKFGAAGAAFGGTVVGGKLADAGGKLAHNANMAFQEGYYGDKNAAIMAQQSREYYNDEEKREFFGDEFEVEGKELDTIMARAADINNQGITDDKAIKETIKLEDSIRKEMKDDAEGSKMAKEQAITIAKLADNYNTEKLRTDEKYRKGVYDDFERGLKKANPDISPRDLKVQKERMMTLLKRYKKID